MEGEALVVQADYGLLRQSIETLTNNAVARASHVWMNVAPFQGWAVLDIADNGPGFDEELLPHVFDRFRRGDTGGSKSAIVLTEERWFGCFCRWVSERRGSGRAAQRVSGYAKDVVQRVDEVGVDFEQGSGIWACPGLGELLWVESCPRPGGGDSPDSAVDCGIGSTNGEGGHCLEVEVGSGGWCYLDLVKPVADCLGHNPSVVHPSTLP